MMQPRKIQQRFLFYLILFGLCCIVPFITMILLIATTGDRESGMSNAMVLSVILVHFIFSAIFLQTRSSLKFSISVLNTVVAIIGLKYILPLKIIHNVFDIYGFWDIILTHTAIAIVIWEITYQVLTKFVRKKTF